MNNKIFILEIKDGWKTEKYIPFSNFDKAIQIYNDAKEKYKKNTKEVAIYSYVENSDGIYELYKCEASFS